MDINNKIKSLTSYINPSINTNITKDELDKMIDICIKNDDREKLWRLAFNTSNSNFNYDNIALYYISKKDSYYLVELLCACKDNINLKKIIDELIYTNDFNFMKECFFEAEKFGLFNNQEKDYIRKRYRELSSNTIDK